MSGTPRKAGRPRVPEPGSAATTWLRISEHDALIAAAKAHERSVSAWLRELVVQSIKQSPKRIG